MNTAAPNDGQWPLYPALWHLESLGITERSGRAGPGWNAARERAIAGGESRRRTRVALLDNSVAWRHPNLDGAIDTARMIDFVSARLGAFPAEHDPESLERVRDPADRSARSVRARDADIARELASSVDSSKDGWLRRLLQELLDRLDTGGAVSEGSLPATRAAFSAHGTAMAGLIGARPARVSPRSPLVDERLHDPVRQALAPSRDVLPYAGVDPFCEIVPISASFDPDPEQYLLALFYAVLVDADVIVLARDFADPSRAPFGDGKPVERALADAAFRSRPTDEERHAWDALEALLDAISRRIPILCAAGNGGGERAIYPASRASDANGIVSVGAVTALERVAGYSPSDANVDVQAPSADGERYDEGLRRLDLWRRSVERREGESAAPAAAPTSVPTPAGAALSSYAPQDLVTTDVPGRFGYNRGHVGASIEDAVSADPGSCYCRFGGTSGAVALAAGFLSLMYSSGALERGDEASAGDRGVRARRALIAAAGANGPARSGDGGGRATKRLHWDRTGETAARR